MRAFQFASAILLLQLLLVASGCSTAPITGRSQFILFSPTEEAQMGASSFQQMKEEIPISTNATHNALVQRVGERIAAVADLPGANWEFVVFDSEQANAFCLPGGKVGIYTGILPITKTEAGLATVIGHEVAHATARHGGERMSTAIALGVAGEAVNYATRDSSEEKRALWATAYGLGASVGVALPHSRAQESEADQIGLIYMAQAGYDPAESIEFWKRFGEFNSQAGGETPWFLRTHPLDETRIRQLEEWLPEARLYYTPRE